MKYANKEKRCYAVKTAADVTDTSKSLLWEKIKTGELKSFKIGAKRLIAAEDLEAWLASYRNGGAAA